MAAMGVEGAARQELPGMSFSTPHGRARYRLPWSWTSFDYKTLCELLWAQCGSARLATAVVHGRTGDTVHTDRGDVTAPLLVDAADGLQLTGTRIAAAVRCAPPANKPTPAEQLTCAPWLDAEWRLVGEHVKVIVALGAFAWRAALQMVRSTIRPMPKFGHAAVAAMQTPYGEVLLLGCFHPSQQNTFTGKLTEPMLDAVLTRATELAATVS